jgi:hypothetical protein
MDICVLLDKKKRSEDELEALLRPLSRRFPTARVLAAHAEYPASVTRSMVHAMASRTAPSIMVYAGDGHGEFECSVIGALAQYVQSEAGKHRHGRLAFVRQQLPRDCYVPRALRSLEPTLVCARYMACLPAGHHTKKWKKTMGTLRGADTQVDLAQCICSIKRHVDILPVYVACGGRELCYLTPVDKRERLEASFGDIAMWVALGLIAAALVAGYRRFAERK